MNDLHARQYPTPRNPVPNQREGTRRTADEPSQAVAQASVQVSEAARKELEVRHDGRERIDILEERIKVLEKQLENVTMQLLNVRRIFQGAANAMK